MTGGLETAGPWYQSPPKDFSKPELRWFSWGFERQALFAATVHRSASGTVRIGNSRTGLHGDRLPEYRRHDSLASRQTG